MRCCINKTISISPFAFSNIVEQPVGDDRDIDATAKIQQRTAEPKMFYRLKIDIKAKQ